MRVIYVAIVGIFTLLLGMLGGTTLILSLDFWALVVGGAIVMN